MSRLREDVIHVSVRCLLRSKGWRLIAGQYPNGSDDELPALNVLDPYLARDNSPDHRRHSKNKFVPDLVACRGQHVLLIEMKPAYSRSDQQKLLSLLSERKPDLFSAFRALQQDKGVSLDVPVETSVFIPCLAFSASSRYVARDNFCYFLVENLYSVRFAGNDEVCRLG